MQQVLYLEVEDDMPAVRELLEGAHARRVLLVVPKGCETLRSTVNLRLLRRYADNLGLDVALVTGDSRTRQAAGEEGLAVVSSVARGRRGRWRSGLPRRSSAQHAAAARVDGLRRGRGDVGYGDRIIVWAGRVLGIMLFALLLVLVFGLAAMVIPQAEVTVVPFRQPIEADLELRADPDVEKASLEKLSIPARIVQAQVEQTGQIATAGKKDAPDAPAKGTVTFINQTSAPLQINPGTLLRTSTGSTIRFQTVSTATLEARTGATAQAEIEALEPGPAGNVPASTITTIETSALRSKARVTNEAPTRGGGLKQVGVVTRDDMDRLKAQVLEQLQDRAYVELLSQLGENEFLPEQSMTVEIMAEVYDQFLDAEADVLNLQMRILASGTAVDRAHANSLAYEALKDKIPSGYDLESQEIEFTLDEEQARMDGRSVLLDASAVAYLRTEIDRGDVRSAVAGLTADEARRVLSSSFALDRAPVVEVGPDWIKRWKLLNRVPRFPFRIQVIILR
jgi:hypothetical protein